MCVFYQDGAEGCLWPSMFWLHRQAARRDTKQISMRSAARRQQKHPILPGLVYNGIQYALLQFSSSQSKKGSRSHDTETHPHTVDGPQKSYLSQDVSHYPKFIPVPQNAPVKNDTTYVREKPRDSGELTLMLSNLQTIELWSYLLWRDAIIYYPLRLLGCNMGLSTWRVTVATSKASFSSLKLRSLIRAGRRELGGIPGVPKGDPTPDRSEISHPSELSAPTSQHT